MAYLFQVVCLDPCKQFSSVRRNFFTRTDFAAIESKRRRTSIGWRVTSKLSKMFFRRKPSAQTVASVARVTPDDTQGVSRRRDSVLDMTSSDDEPFSLRQLKRNCLDVTMLDAAYSLESRRGMRLLTMSLSRTQSPLRKDVVSRKALSRDK